MTTTWMRECLGFSARCTRAILLGVSLIAPRESWAYVECSEGLNCSARRRKPCDNFGIAANACGDCVEGSHGGKGPANTVCLANKSCVLVFPGQDGCPSTSGNGPDTPFVVPFGECQCDVDGKAWPTAPNQCARVIVVKAEGTGLFQLQQCTSPRCEPETCSFLAEWSPMEEAFKCRQQGADSMLLSDGCSDLPSALPTSAKSALCLHPGLVAMKDQMATAWDSSTCELAPRCPESVLDETRLDQTCCTGNRLSNPLTEWGPNTAEQAPGFCTLAAAAASAALTPGSGGGSASGSGKFGCNVISSAPGWRGCACLDANGLPDAQRTCTVECEPPDCPLPEKGIRSTPQTWLTSEVPEHLLPPDRTKLLQGVAAGHRHVPSQPLIVLVTAAVAAMTP